VLSAAGFHEIEESTQNLPWTWPGDAPEVFEYACAVAAPFRAMLDRVPEEEWPSIRAEAEAAIERYRVGDEIRFGADVFWRREEPESHRAVRRGDEPRTMKIKVAWIGKTKEPAIQALTEEYLKRISRYAEIAGVALKDEAAILSLARGDGRQQQQ
jgi:hypothetical protein